MKCFISRRLSSQEFAGLRMTEQQIVPAVKKTCEFKNHIKWTERRVEQHHAAMGQSHFGHKHIVGNLNTLNSITDMRYVMSYDLTYLNMRVYLHLRVVLCSPLESWVDPH